jgi:predicted ATPase
MLRYIITGAPGTGKTTILEALHARGYAVVDEAATDIILREQSLGHQEPWRDAGFIDAITLLQRARQMRPAPPGTSVQLYDRSPICTLALAHHLAHYGGQPVPRVLASEVDRILREGIYQRQVFVIRLLGSVAPTAVRRISYAESVRFGRLHERVYRTHGYELVDVPAGTVAERAELIDRHIRSWVGCSAGGTGKDVRNQGEVQGVP